MTTHDKARELPPAAQPIKDHIIAQTVNQLRDVAIQFHASQQLRHRIAYVIVPLLKAVDQPKESDRLPGAVDCLIRAGHSPEEAARLIDEGAQQSGPACMIDLDCAIPVLPVTSVRVEHPSSTASLLDLDWVNEKPFGVEKVWLIEERDLLHLLSVKIGAVYLDPVAAAKRTCIHIAKPTFSAPVAQRERDEEAEWHQWLRKGGTKYPVRIEQSERDGEVNPSAYKIEISKSLRNAFAENGITSKADTPAATGYRTPLRAVHDESGKVLNWYFDCAGHYIDVERDTDGKYSVYFRNRADQSEAWLDQANTPTTNTVQNLIPDTKKMVSVRDEALDQLLILFAQPFMEYFGSDIQEAIRALKSSEQIVSKEGGEV